jgi:hypothetical protein
MLPIFIIITPGFLRSLTVFKRLFREACRIIVLTINEQNWGPKPLRMLKCWADIPGYADFVKEKWQSLQVYG